MCGILVTNKVIKNLLHIIAYLKNRGPDAITHIKSHNFEFVHTLLNMTGALTTQPFIDKTNDIVAMFNGEIYNYNKISGLSNTYSSDGECIIPCYLKYGNDYVKQFDGEFAIVLCDFKKRIIHITTDIFSTKPLWLALDTDTRNIGISSYESCLTRLGFKNPVQIPANTTLIVNQMITDPVVISSTELYTFDLKQYKTTTNDFNAALERSVRKRTQNAKHGIFIGLSSGYDSGTISCILNRQNTDYTAYSIIGSEDKNIIDVRSKLTKKFIELHLRQEDFMTSRQYLKNNCEEYKLNIDNGDADKLETLCNKYITLQNTLVNKPCTRELEKLNLNLQKTRNLIDFRKNGQVLTDDNGSIGMSYICNIARKKKQLIYLSGSGADEIFSDYGYKGIKHYGHSTIGGKFPEDLTSVFPWKNFFANTQRAYLAKEEYVTGSYGIEGRYPFLDKDVVQEFLWLSTSIKNEYYKAPLHLYMNSYSYPFKINNKIGFNCGFTGVNNAHDSYTPCISSSTIVGTAKYEELVVDFNKLTRCNHIYFFDIDKIKHVKGNCYSYSLDTDYFVRILGKRPLPGLLYENGILLSLPGASVGEIEHYGLGRYTRDDSNADTDTVYFSSSDNANPLVNGKIYKYVKQ